MITNERNRELSTSRFYERGNGHYKFEYRGVIIDVTLLGTIWFCVDKVSQQSITLPTELPAIEMAERLRQWILETVPADRLREEGYNSLDWIGASVRHSLAQERAKNAVSVGTIPFCGELDPQDADDSIPARYGL